jgi:catalase
LQVIGRKRDTLEGRAIGILLAEGSDALILKAVMKAIAQAGATARLVAPKIAGTRLSDGSVLQADGQLSGTPSMPFDAVVVLLSDAAAMRLAKESAAIDFLRDAYCHLKAIGVDAGGAGLVASAGLPRDAGVIQIVEVTTFLRAARTRQWAREASVRALP